MYKAHFAVQRPLFSDGIVRDAEVFLGPRQQLTIANLKIALSTRDSIAVLSGVPGVGKTTLASYAVRAAATRLALGWLGAPSLTPHELLEQLLTEFDLSPYKASRVERLQIWRQFLSEMSATDTRVCVLVETADGYSPEVLRALGQLTSADPSGCPGANVILTSATPARELLVPPGLEIVKQRLRLSGRVEPLNASEMEAYLRQRVALAGAEFDRIFAPGTATLLQHYSGGLIRVANNLAESALTVAATRREPALRPELLMRVAVGLFGMEPIALPKQGATPVATPAQAVEPTQRRQALVGARALATAAMMAAEASLEHEAEPRSEVEDSVDVQGDDHIEGRQDAEARADAPAEAQAAVETIEAGREQPPESPAEAGRSGQEVDPQATVGDAAAAEVRDEPPSQAHGTLPANAATLGGPAAGEAVSGQSGHSEAVSGGSATREAATDESREAATDESATRKQASSAAMTREAESSEPVTESATSTAASSSTANAAPELERPAGDEPHDPLAVSALEFVADAPADEDPFRIDEASLTQADREPEPRDVDLPVLTDSVDPEDEVAAAMLASSDDPSRDDAALASAIADFEAVDIDESDDGLSQDVARENEAEARRRDAAEALAHAKALEDISNSMAETLFGDAELEALSATLAVATDEAAAAEGARGTVTEDREADDFGGLSLEEEAPPARSQAL